MNDTAFRSNNLPVYGHNDRNGTRAYRSCTLRVPRVAKGEPDWRRAAGRAPGVTSGVGSTHPQILFERKPRRSRLDLPPPLTTHAGSSIIIIFVAFTGGEGGGLRLSLLKSLLKSLLNSLLNSLQSSANQHVRGCNILLRSSTL